MVVDAFVGDPSNIASRTALASETELVAPAILLAEAASALRSMALRGDVSAARARAALREAATLRLTRFPFEPFVDRVWELRENVTVYDAWYLALAETLGVALLTADRRLAGAPGARCEIRLVSA